MAVLVQVVFASMLGKAGSNKLIDFLHRVSVISASVATILIKRFQPLGSQLAGMRNDVERLRRAASAGRGGVPAGAGSACVAYQRQVSDCKRLLAEGAELLSEGGGLVGGLSADRNAVREALKP